MSIKRATNFTATITFTDSSGTGLNITGGTVRFMIKSNIGDADSAAVISKDNAGLGGVTLTTPLSGIATATITGAEANALIGDSNCYAEAIFVSGGVIASRTDYLTINVTANVIKVYA